jgi:branched-chain amino acid aminotransferase
MIKIWQNGNLVPFESATTHVMSHGLHYGSGVFEGIRAYELSDGTTGVFALTEHVKRMFDSAAPIGMKIPYTQEEFCQAIINTVKANGYKSCYIRPLAYYGNPPSGVRVRPDPKTKVEVIISCYDMGNYLPDVPLNVLISDFIRIHPNSTAVGAKICGHYVNSLQALLAIQHTNYDEVILLDHEGYVAEGSSENIFVVKDGVITTPKLGTILTGITRKIIMGLASDLGYPVVEGKILPAELFTADEVFFTGTAVEVRGAGHIDDKVIGAGGEGKITQHIKNEYKKIYRGENPKYAHYLTAVK